jgi:hypothetical protein
VHLGVGILDVAHGEHGDRWKLAFAQFEAERLGYLDLSDRGCCAGFLERSLDQLRFLFFKIRITAPSSLSHHG